MGETQTGPLHGAPIGAVAIVPITRPRPRPTHAAIDVGDPGTEHDVERPQRRSDQDEHEAWQVVVDFYTAEYHDANDRERQCDAVPYGPCRAGCNEDWSNELDRDAFAQVNAVDGQVKEDVHQRCRDAE